MRRVHVAFPLPDKQFLARVLRPESADLQKALRRWFKKNAQAELLETLHSGSPVNLIQWKRKGRGFSRKVRPNHA